jgi:toxin secretion/phage lysis holin
MDLSTFSYSHIYWIFLLPLIGAGADIVTGWIQATINGTWDSTKMRKGLYRKGGELLVVIIAFIAEEAVPALASYRLATWISFYIVVMEAVSVLENLNQAGVNFPKVLLKKLGKVKEELDGDDEDDGK